MTTEKKRREKCRCAQHEEKKKEKEKQQISNSKRILLNELDFTHVIRYFLQQKKGFKMGCINSSSNRIEVVHLFNSNEQMTLTQSWNIVKANQLRKFADEILIRFNFMLLNLSTTDFFVLFSFRSMKKSSALRRFWISKIIVDGNNYDYGQSESCLRTDLSWHVELLEYCVNFVEKFDRLLTSLMDESNFNNQLRSSSFPESISQLEYESLLVKFRFDELFRFI